MRDYGVGFLLIRASLERRGEHETDARNRRRAAYRPVNEDNININGMIVPYNTRLTNAEAEIARAHWEKPAMDQAKQEVAELAPFDDTSTEMPIPIRGPSRLTKKRINQGGVLPNKGRVDSEAWEWWDDPRNA